MRYAFDRVITTISVLWVLLLIMSSSEVMATPGSENTKPGKQPNIIIIMTDDMGYSDPSSYGGELHTPSIDQLAEQGIRFTRFHNCGMCVMTRAAMMTSNYSPYAQPNFNKLPLL